ncbi:MAG: major facilitator superfamily transporter, partial [Herbinix sp.]|nr:major facilitator superfamily transporter [Herbinix sp.]
IEQLQSSDVTTITEDTKLLSSAMFDLMTPEIILKIQDGLQNGVTALEESASGMEEGITQLQAAATATEDVVQQQALQGQLAGLTGAKAEIEDTIGKMTALKDAIPVAFETAKEAYLSELENLQDPIESEYQVTLNKGFKELYLTVTVASLLGLGILLFYRKKREENF